MYNAVVIKVKHVSTHGTELSIYRWSFMVSSTEANQLFVLNL